MEIACKVFCLTRLVFGGSVILDKNVTIPLLMDLYGNMLSKSKFEDLYAYYNEDFSLSEIAANTNKTRQAVFDSVKHSESALLKAEDELGFLKKMDLIKSDFEEIERIIKKLQSEKFLKEEKEISENFKKILEITKKYSDD